MPSFYDKLAAQDAAEAPAAPSFYDKLEQQDAQEGQLRASVGQALQTTPEKAAKVKYLSAVTGFTPSVVETNEGEAQAIAKFKEIQEQSAFSPVLQEKLRNPDFTKFAQNEVHKLSAVEHVVNAFRDVGVTAVKGAVGLPQAAVGLASILSKGQAGKDFEAGGVRFNDAQNILDSWYSDRQKQANKNVSEADGFVDTFAELLKNPSVIATSIGESLPQMLGGAAIGRGVVTAFAKAAPWLAAALGEGVISAGSSAEQYRSKTDDGLLSAKQSLAALLSGAGTAAFGAAGGRLAQKFKLADLDTALVQGGFTPAAAESVKKGFLSSAAKAFISEGLLEEMPQSVQEQMFQNFAFDRPLSEGVGKVAAQALLVGGVMGSGAQGVARIAGRARQAEVSAQETDALQKLLKTAAGIDMRVNDSKSFSEFVQAAADHNDSAPKSVFVDGKTLAETLQQTGVTPEQLNQLLPSVATQLDDAVRMNSAIEIPIGELATSLPGHALEQALLPHLRTREDGLSQAEAKQGQEQAQQLLQQEAQTIIQQASDSVNLAAEQDQVRQHYAEQLGATGRHGRDATAKMATLMGNWYTIMAARAGKTPMQLFNEQRVTVGAQGQQQGVLNAGSPHAMTVEGFHYSKDNRSHVSTGMFGTGLQGSSKDEYLNATDKRLAKRAYFYADKGTGITPEAGVGGHGHKARLSNVYDADTDPLRLNKGGKLAFESAVLDAGFSGYLNRLEGSQPGQVVMLGDQDIPVESLGPLANTKGTVVPPRGDRESRGRDQIGDRLRANKMLPSGSPTRARWAEILQAQMPLEYEALRNAGVFEGKPTDALYKSDLLKAFEAATPAESYEQTTKATLPAKPQGPEATLDDFGPERVGDILKRSRWAVLTAENPRGEQATPEENSARMQELRADLDAAGVTYTNAVGKYGNVENSLILVGVDEADAIALGAKYDQDSVLTNRGLIYPRDNTVTPVTGSVEVFTSTPEDFYTLVPSTGAQFAIDLDWSGAASTVTTAEPTNKYQQAYLAGRNPDVLNQEERAQFDELATPLLAPNGKPSKLSAKHHALVRTPAFKAWFGDWEAFAAQEGGVWADAKDEVSKAVDENGEPLVLYHGTDTGSFRAFREAVGEKRGDLGIFMTPNRDMARSYVKRGRGVDFTPEQLDDEGEKLSGIYPLFANIRNPNEEHFAGANWDGSRDEQYEVYDANGDVVYDKNGNEFVDYETAQALAEEHSGTFGEASPGISTDQVVRDAHKYKNDGAIIRSVVDDGGGDSAYYGDPSDVFVAFTNAQVKSVDNFGEFADPNDLLHQPARGTFDPATLHITLNETANLSTFLHEAGHAFLEITLNMARDPNATADVKAMADQILKSFKLTADEWHAMTLDQKRKHHERFAETFELYLMTGKSPNVEMQSLFRTFSAWLKRIYQSVQKFAGAKGIELDPDLKQVMDRMLASDAQIAEAEHVAGLLPDLNATAEAQDQLRARSIRDMKWGVNARNKFIKEMQKDAKEKRKAMTAEAASEVDATPEMRAKKALDMLKVDPDYAVALKVWNETRAEQLKQSKEALEAELLAANPDVKGLKKGQLLMANKRQIANQAEANALAWEKQNQKPKRPINMTDADVAAVADSFGYESPEQMVQAIDAFGPRAAAIEGITDQRMLERYGDLSDQAAIEQAATEAVHNEARAKSLATELAAQREMLGARQDTGKVNAKGQRITANALAEAAKQFAANVIGRRKTGELKRAAWSHLQAERRAGAAWEAATAKGDTEAAVSAKQDQVLNNAAVRAATEAQAEVQKTLAFFAKVTKGNNEAVVEKGRDPDIVNAARAILAAYGVAPRLEKGALEYLKVLKANDPTMYGALEDSLTAALDGAKPISDLTVSELGALKDEIESLWVLSKRSRQMEVDGTLMDLDEAAERLKARMEDIGMPSAMPGDHGAITEADKFRTSLQFAGALLTRVEQWAEGKDGKFGGPFLRLVFGPVKRAADAYRADRSAFRKAYTELVKALAPHAKPGVIAAPELGYTFGQGKGGVGVAELTHAILHTGNASNKRKLLLGRGWAVENDDGTLNTGRWDSFIKRMHDIGVIGKPHYDFAQGVWDLLESMKPLAQKAHRDVFGRYFAEVTADAFTTPFGDYKGGYVPAQVDPGIVKDHELRNLAEVENQSMAYAFPSTSKGFTKSRTEYNRPLMLDLRTISQHIDKVLLFSHMEPAVRDVNKLIGSKGVAHGLNRQDPAAIAGMLTPWLNRAARQQVETPVIGDGRVSRLLSVIRQRAGMSVMVANLSNAIQQVAGLSLAAVKVKPGNLVSATAQYVSNPKKMSEAVAKASSFMDTRMNDQIASLNGVMEDILLNPSAYEKAKSFTSKHAYFLQTALDNVLGPIVWTGAYNQAIKEGMSDTDAVKFADGTIRQTQGSTLAEDVSRIETGPAYARLFTQFIGYFNMVANTNATALKQIAQDTGLKKGAGKALGIVFFGLLAPAWIAEAVAVAFKGGPDDEDKDGSYLDDWLMAVFGLGTLKTLLAGVPFVGQFVMAGVNSFNSKPYDDRTSLSPAVSLLEGTVGAPHSVYKALVDNGSKQKAVRDVATAVSLMTGLPASAAARPLGYLAGVADHKVNPTDGLDMARGLATGTASPASKQ